uniref:Uncharacterized protein n=1 Tax=Vitis vinifera TaxID=29760 RepID=A5AJF3_VITVI|nr:hypothetical protein VITISV_025440 [Vitis vinifera]
MTTNLRVGFHEGQRKRLSESIAIGPSSSKKAHPAPSLDSPSKPTPSTQVWMTNPPLLVIFPTKRLGNPLSSWGTSKRIHSSVQILLFMAQRHKELFLATQRILVEVDDLNQSFMVRLLYGTLDIAIVRIIHMKDYTTFEIVEMVIVEVCNLIRQRAHFLQQLEAVETMMAYIAHNMDKNEELLVDLKMVRGEDVASQKLVEECVCLLRKVKEENEAS